MKFLAWLEKRLDGAAAMAMGGALGIYLHYEIGIGIRNCLVAAILLGAFSLVVFIARKIRGQS